MRARGSWWVAAVTGLSLLACTSPGSSLPGGDVPAEVPGRPADGPWVDEPELPDAPGKKAKRRVGEDDGDRRGKGKRPHREPPPDTRPEPVPGRERERAPDGGEAPEVRGITYEGNDTWAVDRSKLEGWVSDPTRLGATATKKSNGYSLDGVREGSDAAALGAESGDVVKRVNGKSLTSTTDLLQLWAELETAKSFRVELLRDGSARVHQYRMR